jgi:hypothetical protein
MSDLFTVFEHFFKQMNEKFSYFEDVILQLKNQIQDLTTNFTQERNELINKNQKLLEENYSYQYQITSYQQMFLNKDNPTSRDVNCVLCLDNHRNVLFKPCNHFVICDECSGNTDFEKCIICNAILDSYEYAYLV